MQAVAQAPQCAISAFRLTSQPVATLLSQLPAPALHAAIWHTPVLQEPVAFCGLHGWPQTPQFVLVLSCVSQPLAALESQSPHPA